MDPPITYLISNQGSDRATTGCGGKVVTRNGKTHIVWQDNTNKGLLNRVRTLDHGTGTLTEPVTLTEGKDNHARPNLLIDYDGYLHVVNSGHNSPVIYRRSREPNDTSRWTDPETIGEGTYPFPVCARDGTLYVTMRSADSWNGVDFYAKPPDGSWRQRAKLVNRHPDLDGYASYMSALTVAPDGALYVVIDFYEGKGIHDQRGLHMAVATMQSTDGGHTWTTCDGSPIDLPARPPEMDVIARDQAPERPEDKPVTLVAAKGNIVLDDTARPHILYLDHRHGPGKLMHAYTEENGEWSREPITALEDRFPEHRPINHRGALTIRNDGTIFALIRLLALGDGWQDGLPTRELRTSEYIESRLGWLVSRDKGSTWVPEKALNSPLINEPNVERAVGGGVVNDNRPRFIYFDGGARTPDKGEALQYNVYLVESSCE